MGVCADSKVSRSVRGKQKRRKASGCVTKDRTVGRTQRPHLRLLFELQGRAGRRDTLGVTLSFRKVLSQWRVLLKPSPPFCFVPEP